MTVGDVATSDGKVRREIKLGPHQTKGSKGRTVVLSTRVRREIAVHLKFRQVYHHEAPLRRTFATRLNARTIQGGGERGRTPRRSRTEREQRAWQAADQVGFGTCRGERKANAAGGLDDTGGDFQETKTQRRELGSGQFPDFGNGVAHGQHQPIGGGMEHEADLVGERRTATGAIGGELRLMQLDQILGLAARAIQAVVDPLGRADIEAGDDEADVEAELVASIRATVRRSRSQDFALWRVSV